MKQCTAVRLALVWILLGAAPLAAQKAEPRPLVVTAMNLTADSARMSGQERKDKAMARPGDVLGYALAFTNVNRAAVKQVQFVDPLPQGLVYRTGTARADQPTVIEYSIDGGKSYSARPTVRVMENGRQVEKPAPREAYTHIRWTVAGPLAPGAQVTAGFQAEVGQSASETK
jgi:uncharacterized repeat protein (TIGR01451 family)